MKKILSVQDKVFDLKLFKNDLDKGKCEEFEMALQHKSKMCVHKELIKIAVGSRNI